MYQLHHFALIFHISCGAVALVIFWIPVLTRKGSPIHKKIGRIFVYGMTAIAVSGILLSSITLFDPVGLRTNGQQLPMADAFQMAEMARVFALFLLMLSCLVLTAARHATLVLKAKRDRSLLRTPFHVGSQIMTGVLAVVTGVVGVLYSQPLLIVFFFIGAAGAYGTLRYTFKARLDKNEWIIEHIGSTIGTGIAAYTAFFAFGGRELIGRLMDGPWQLVPWVLPTIIGTIYSRRLVTQYRNKFATA